MKSCRRCRRTAETRCVSARAAGSGAAARAGSTVASRQATTSTARRRLPDRVLASARVIEVSPAAASRGRDEDAAARMASRYRGSERDRIRQRGDAAATGPVVLVADHLRGAEDVELVQQVLHAERELAVTREGVIHAQVEQGVAAGVFLVAVGGAVVGAGVAAGHVAAEQRGE